MTTLTSLIFSTSLLALGLCYGSAITARADPPLSSDSTLSPWFRSLVHPHTQTSCCSIADCRTVVTRDRDGQTWAFIGGDFKDSPNAWVIVPEDVTLHGHSNPTGEPVLCWRANSVRCFVPASGT